MYNWQRDETDLAMVHAVSIGSVCCANPRYVPFVTHHLPKSILFFVIPAYILLSVGSYRSFKALGSK